MPQATSCGGYTVFDSTSISQFVSSVFIFDSATPLDLKPLEWISWNFEVMKHMMCKCACAQEILIHYFPESNAPSKFRNILLKQFASATPLNRSTECHSTPCNVVDKDIQWNYCCSWGTDVVICYHLKQSLGKPHT